MLNQLFRRLRDLNREIARAEEHFGMTPLGRLRLGVTCLKWRRKTWRRSESGDDRTCCDAERSDGPADGELANKRGETVMDSIVSRLPNQVLIEQRGGGPRLTTEYEP